MEAVGVIVVLIGLFIAYRLMLGGSIRGGMLLKIFGAVLLMVIVFTLTASYISGGGLFKGAASSIVSYWPGGNIVVLWVNRQTVTPAVIALEFLKLIFILPLRMLIRPTMILKMFSHHQEGGSGILRIPQLLFLGMIDFLVTIISGFLVEWLLSYLVAQNILNLANKLYCSLVLVGAPLILIAFLVLTISGILKAFFRFDVALYIAKVLLGIVMIVSWTYGVSAGITVSVVCFFVSGLLSLINENETMNRIGGGLFWKSSGLG